MLNPGNECGKRELSLSLRNPLIDSWRAPIDSDADLLEIIGVKAKRSEITAHTRLSLEFMSFPTGLKKSW
jgi:midasin (ATPase involved in ribosome maturation)